MPAAKKASTTMINGACHEVSKKKLTLTGAVFFSANASRNRKMNIRQHHNTTRIARAFRKEKGGNAVAAPAI